MLREQDAHPRPNLAALAAVAVLLLLVYAPTMAWMAHRWSLGIWYHSHGWAVPPLAAWLCYRGLRHAGSLPRDASPLGFLFLVPAVLLQAFDALVGFQLLSAVSLVLAVPGLSLLFLGRERTRRAWFGIFFLVFAVPVPLAIVARVHLALRGIAAVGTEKVLSTIGYDVTRDGTLLQIDSSSIEIADACSGFATLMALTMAGFLLVYLARGRVSRKLVVLALVFPMASIANIVRCSALSMLVVAFGPEILETFIHELSGIVAFIIALVLLQLAMYFLLPEDDEEEVPA